MKQGSWKLIAIIVMVYVLIYAVFLREDWVVQAINLEAQNNQSMFGDDLAANAHDRGTRWFSAVFVDTGVMQDVFDLYTVPAERRAQDQDFGTLVPWFFEWFEMRLKVLFTIAYQFFLRASAAAMWLPYALVLIVPCLVDGIVRRKIKRTNFDYTSPLIYRYGIWAAEIVFVGALLVFIAPWPLPAWVVPAMLLTIAVALNFVASNVQKEI